MKISNQATKNKTEVALVLTKSDLYAKFPNSKPLYWFPIQRKNSSHLKRTSFPQKLISGL